MNSLQIIETFHLYFAKNSNELEFYEPFGSCCFAMSRYFFYTILFYLLLLELLL